MSQLDCQPYDEVSYWTLCFGGLMLIAMVFFSYRFTKHFGPDCHITTQIRVLSIILMFITLLESLITLFRVSMCLLPNSFVNYELMVTNVLSLLWTSNCVFVCLILYHDYIQFSRILNMLSAKVHG